MFAHGSVCTKVMINPGLSLDLSSAETLAHNYYFFNLIKLVNIRNIKVIDLNYKQDGLELQNKLSKRKTIEHKN